MKWLNIICLSIFLNAFVQGQTVHIENDRIVYKGKVSVANASKREVYERAKEAIGNHVRTVEFAMEDNKEEGTITVFGTIKLTTPYHLKRTVGYMLQLSIDDHGYQYRIDSVYMKQVERGGNTIRLSSEELFKGIEATGPESIDAEKQLNEIDMKFQKILALINRDIRKDEVVVSR